MSQASQPLLANATPRADQRDQKSPLFTEPLSNHSASQMVAAVRTALENGDDVNQLDTDPHLGLNAGRPLDACLRASLMPGRKSIIENLPVIQLLLEHGADPRLYSRSAKFPPLALATSYSERDSEAEEEKAFWKYLLKLFKEAIVRLDAKDAAGTEEQAGNGE